MKNHRKTAIESAINNNAISGLTPSPFAISIFEQWILGHWTTNEAVELLRQYHIELELTSAQSDLQASPNMLGITDTTRMRQAEADLTTLRMADMTN
ncbi:MAG: antitoxin VbhA family protein [Herminiimonas sp.]|uniref:antitoxin VbhA family protein n=1 Tax=Herminiimonas sp. TaxID=1926289 RepID=UPI00271A90FE|nr:antitoxin VbhA family protein [Herminiimonas sp.]MDO9421068.1 antitoxin VbhA family protein [Herminiimonas sp.]